ncbi:MAG: DUF2063 domain-containing protein [Rhodobacterales bacterium 17-64-5]|nr:MAG: DUF2063 domain-containing protein [Rhodobacterales bacterium 17-64-5]
MTQSVFAAALMDPNADLPPGLVGPDGLPAPRRFAVYRNTVAASLTRVLEAGFPTVRKLVGEAFFGAMAVAFLRAHPPRVPQLMQYGADLPGFLASFPPVAHLGYLPDVARLDQAMRESYHAADSTPLSAVELQRLLSQDIAALRFTLAAALRLIRSPWPLMAIWAANHANGPTPVAGAQDVVVLRAEFDPVPHLLPPGVGAFLAGLLERKTLGESAALAGKDFDLATTLGVLMTGRAMTGVLQ